MARIGNEAKFILKLAETKMQKWIDGVKKDLPKADDFAYRKGGIIGMEQAIRLMYAVVTELEAKGNKPPVTLRRSGRD